MKNKKKQDFEKYYDYHVWGHKSLYEFIEEKAKKYSKNVAITEGEIEGTYEMLENEINNYAVRMSEDGIQKDDKVVIQLPNCIEFVFIIFALFRIGALPVLALANHRKIEIK